MEIDPQIEQIITHIKNLNSKQKIIKPRVEKLFPSKDITYPVDSIFKLCSDFPAIRSIGKLAAMKDFERNAILNMFADQKDGDGFIRWLIHSLTVDDQIFKELQHVFCNSFTDRHFESSVLHFSTDKDRLKQLEIDKSISLTHNKDDNSDFIKPGYSLTPDGQVSKLSLYALNLDSIPQYIFLFSHLKELDLSHNKLTHISNNIKYLKQIESINLKYNRIEEIPYINHLTRLKRIDLAFNQLYELPDFFGQFIHLSELNLENNNLKSLPKQIVNLNNLSYLNISYNQLTELPEQIGQLAHLKKLIINNNNVAYLPDSIVRLSDLTALYVNHNQLNVLPDDLEKLRSLEIAELEGNKLQTLPDALWQLKRIRVLSLKSNQIQSISQSINNLVHLEELDLSDNQLKQIPKEIFSLRHLKRLYVANNYISEFELPEKMNMIPLIDFDCSGNELTELPVSLWDIESIEILNINKNRITRIPFQFSNLKRLSQFNCDYNPIKSPPPEIIQKGKFAIWNYFIELEDSEPLFEAKLIIVGEPEAGKTCLRKKIMDPTCDVKKLDNPIQPTRGIDIDICEFSTSEIPQFKMNIWDFGGQTIYHTMHQFFLTKRSYYLFVWEARRNIDYHNFKYWLNIIQLLGKNSPVTVVMNKSDQYIKEIDQRDLKNNYKNIISFFQVSCYTDNNIEQLVQHIKEKMVCLEHVGSDWPKRWKDIRLEIEQSSKNFLPYEEYLILCQSYSMDEHQANYLSDYLHDLGVILHFQNDPLLKNILIIKPEKALHAVYRILDDQQTIMNMGCFSRDDLNRLWKGFSADKHTYLLQLMIKFELCFHLPDTPEYIVPQLLPGKEPDEIELWKKKTQTFLHFEYHYSFMPAGIISRLIARNHQNIPKHTYWKSGFIFKYKTSDDKTSEALVTENRVSDNISIQIKGPENERKVLRDIIKFEINRIHQSLNTPEVKEMIPCSCQECRSADSAHLFDYSILKKMKDKGKKIIPCFKSFEDVSIDELLEGQNDIPNIFICYSHKDNKQKDALLTHLNSLSNSNIIRILYDQDIQPGNKWDEEIRHAISISELVVLLISPNFLASEYIRQSELPQIYQDNQKKIIPILIKPCNWTTNDQLKKLQMFPSDGTPLWSDKDSESYIPHSKLAEITSYIERHVKKDI